MSEEAACPECGSLDVTQTTKTDEYGEAEFRCSQCGAYFVAEVSEDAPSFSYTEIE